MVISSVPLIAAESFALPVNMNDRMKVSTLPVVRQVKALNRLRSGRSGVRRRRAKARSRSAPRPAEPPPGPGDRSVSFAFAAGFGNDQPERDGIVADAVDQDKAAEIAAFPVRHQRHRPVESDGHPGEAVDVDGLGIHLAVVINVDGVIDRGDRCRRRARADTRDEAAAFAQRLIVHPEEVGLRLADELDRRPLRQR